MATPSDVSVGLAHELTITVTKVGWEPKDLADLAHSEDKARQVLNYLRGLAEIKPILHPIDCDANPFIPEGWCVEEHTKGGIFTWNPAKVKLFLSKHQMGGKCIKGTELREELKSKPVLNANVLDCLLKPENQHLIPEDWKGKHVYFWGTIYRDSDGSLYVRYLYWSGGRWDWNYHWLGSDFVSSDSVVVRAS